MATAVVTGGAGFLGSHLCDYLLARGDRVICVDNLETSTLRNIEHIRDDDFVFVHHDVVDHLEIDEPVDVVYHLAALASPIDYLRQPLHSLKVGLVRDAQRARPREAQARPLPARVDERGLRRPARPPAAGELLGERQPDRPARCLRRGEALRGGADDGLPRPAGRRHRDRAHLQHVRPAHAAARRPCDPDLRPPGARRRAAHRLRRRIADAELLLRRRSDPRPLPARDERGAPAGQHRQPRRVHAARARASSSCGVTGSSSEIVFEALPVDDPKVRQPDITRAQQVLGWEPEVSLEDGLRRLVDSISEPGRKSSVRSAASRRSRRRSRRSPWRLSSLTASAASSSTCSSASTTRASRSTATRSPRSSALQVAARAGDPPEPALGRPAAVAKRRPMNPTDPNDSAYDWSALRPRRAVRGQIRRSRSSSRSSAPPAGRTAARGRTARRRNVERPPGLRARGGHALQRHVDGHRRPAAAGRAPLGGVERAEQPRLPAAAVPARPRGKWIDPERGRLRQDLRRPSTPASTPRASSAEKVACGVTAPRGNNKPRRAASRRSRRSSFLEAAARGRAQALRRLGAPSVLRSARPRRRRYAANGHRPGADRGHAREHRDADRGGHAATTASKPIWITEYGYQTNPPDRFVGVSWAKQASYLTQAFAIARKNPRIAADAVVPAPRRAITRRLAVGPRDGDGQKKPAFTAFQRLAR